MPPSARLRPQPAAAGAGRRRRGFTLIELMITVAIVALLAAIALPGYQRYVRNAERDYATGWMTEKLSEMERIRLRNGDFPRSGGNLDRSALMDALTGVDATTAFLGQRSGLTAAVADNSRFRVELEADADEQPRLRLVAIGAQAEDDDCAELLLDASGGRSSLDKNGADSTARCWR